MAMQVPQQTTTWIEKDGDYENHITTLVPYPTQDTSATVAAPITPSSNRVQVLPPRTTSGGRDFELHVIELQTEEGAPGPVHQDVDVQLEEILEENNTTTSTETPSTQQQQPATSNTSSINIRGRRGNTRNTLPLIEWLEMHQSNPYPSKFEKEQLALVSQLTLRQLNDWFANARRNIKRFGYAEWRKKRSIYGFAQVRHLRNNKDKPPPPNISASDINSHSHLTILPTVHQPTNHLSSTTASITAAIQQHQGRGGGEERGEERGEVRRGRKRPRREGGGGVISYHPITPPYYGNGTTPSTIPSFFHHPNLPPSQTNGHIVQQVQPPSTYQFFTMMPQQQNDQASKELNRYSNASTYNNGNGHQLMIPIYPQYNGVSSTSNNNSNTNQILSEVGILPSSNTTSSCNVPVITSWVDISNSSSHQYSNSVINFYTPAAAGIPPLWTPPPSNTNPLVHSPQDTSWGPTTPMNGYSPLTPSSASSCPAVAPLSSHGGEGSTNVVTTSQAQVYFEGGTIRNS